MNFLRHFYPITLIAGTIIGAGVFSLPYVFAQAGWLPSIVYLFGFSFLVTFIHLSYADIILGTATRHRLPGHVHLYFGKTAFYGALGILVLSMVFTLAVYLALAPSFAAFAHIPLTSSTAAMLFWATASIVLFLSAATIARAEFAATVGMLAIIAVIFFVSVFSPGVDGEGIAGGIQRFFDLPPIVFSSLLIPFGPILFSFAGRTAIPPAIEYLRTLRGHDSYQSRALSRSVLRVVIIGTLLPAIAYLFFILGIFGVSQEVSPDAISGILFQGQWIRLLIGTLGIGAIWSSYIIIGRDIIDTLVLDEGVPYAVAVFLAIFFPISIFLFGSQDFLQLVGITGGIFLVLEQIIILMTWRKMRTIHSSVLLGRFPRVSSALFFFLLAMLCFGFVLQALDIFG